MMLHCSLGNFEMDMQEHVNIENEIEKELQRAGDRGGIKDLLQVTPLTHMSIRARPTRDKIEPH